MVATNASTPQQRTGYIPCSTLTQNPLKRNAVVYIELSNEGYLHIVIVAVLVSMSMSMSMLSSASSKR